MASAQRDEFLKMPLDEALEKQGVDKEKGLSPNEAARRLKDHGLNTIEQNRESKWKKLAAFFWGPIPWMIEAALVLSGVLQRWPDFIMILALLLINAALGFIQEHKADNAIEALKQRLALKARVLRGGHWLEIDATHLVPGDIISLKLGNIIPADVKLLDGEYLSVDQAALTGESLPVNKEPGDVAYSGSVAKVGEMTALVTHTGMNTFFGRTAKLVDSAQTKSHFQEAVIKIGNFLIYSTLTVAAIILVVSLFRIEVFTSSHQTIGQLVIFMLVLIIAGIPVALPAVLSVTMAIGANKMAKLKAVVSKLVAIEELAGMDVLCSDKTGTLTKNQLTLGDIQRKEAKDNEEVLLIASLASKPGHKDAIDDAIFDQLQNKEAIKDYEILKYTPFDPKSKRATALVKDPSGKSYKVCKGAPQIVLDLCSPSLELHDEITREIDNFADRGYRTLGVIRSDGDNDNFTFLGLIPLFDPPRDDTRETVDHIQGMGVKVKMVTGDHTAIAKELAAKLDLGTNIYPSKEIVNDDDVFTEKQGELIEKADGFAEVFPEHKFSIVKHLQDKEHIVGMTGDGVNDAPSP